MKKNKLKLARKKIDQLDQRIFDLLKKRTQIIRYMLSLKKFKNEIIKNIKNKSLKNKIDPKITTRIWKSIIWSYIDYQKKNFKKR